MSINPTHGIVPRFTPNFSVSSTQKEETAVESTALISQPSMISAPTSGQPSAEIRNLIFRSTIRDSYDYTPLLDDEADSFRLNLQSLKGSESKEALTQLKAAIDILLKKMECTEDSNIQALFYAKPLTREEWQKCLILSKPIVSSEFMEVIKLIPHYVNSILPASAAHANAMKALMYRTSR